MFDPEYNQKLMDRCKELIVVTDTPILFSDPIVIKTSPHKMLFQCCGVIMSVHGNLSMMDEKEVWHQVEPKQANAGYLLQSLYQRIKSQSFRKTTA